MDTTLALAFSALQAGARGRGHADRVVSEVTTPGMSGPTDGELIVRVSRGDTAAFATLYRRYERPLFGFLKRVAG